MPKARQIFGPIQRVIHSITAQLRLYRLVQFDSAQVLLDHGK